jgi:heme-degrading monooxygenase HmoA
LFLREAAVATLSNDVYIVLVRYTVKAEDQAELVEVLKRSAGGFEPLPGFLSLTIHRGLNGEEILVYLQWRSQEDSDACMTNPIWLEAGKELYTHFIQTGRATMDPQPYQIVYALETSTVKP